MCDVYVPAEDCTGLRQRQRLEDSLVLDALQDNACSWGSSPCWRAALIRRRRRGLILRLFGGGLRCLLRQRTLKVQRPSGCPWRGMVGIKGWGGRDLLPSGRDDADGGSTLFFGQLCPSNESTDSVLCDLARPLCRASLVIAVPWIHRVRREVVSQPHPLPDDPRGKLDSGSTRPWRADHFICEHEQIERITHPATTFRRITLKKTQQRSSIVLTSAGSGVAALKKQCSMADPV